MRSLERVNKELWLILSMFVIAMLLNFIVDAQRMMVSFYTLPTLGSAYSVRPAARHVHGLRERPAGGPAHPLPFDAGTSRR